MLYNVPRLGAAGGFVHASTGGLLCPVFRRDIPLDQIRVGDHVKATFPSLRATVRNAYAPEDESNPRKRWQVYRTVTVQEIHGPIFRVTTSTRQGLINITRENMQGMAWGMR